MADTTIEIATEVTPELLDALRTLLAQLSSSAPLLTEANLAEIVAAPATVLLLARLQGRIVGTLTLVLFRIPSGARAWIEDVVVDETARGQGVGAALSRTALQVASEAGARTVDLSSRPSRAAANRLYERLGFYRRDTNVYRFDV